MKEKWRHKKISTNLRGKYKMASRRRRKEKQGDHEYLDYFR